MNLLSLPSLHGLHPRRYGLVSWSAHVSFAFDLVTDFRPRTLVELGTHSGESYFAFCQSAQENRTGTTCFAVDTWKGDAQAGFYPEDVYADVYRHNQEFYADFSYLVRASFDDAVDRFADGSVDLIHFDGLHTYEAVRHDLERWRPKLSPRGVALFHDIVARHDDFAAWRLWEEIRREGQSFAFRHGWGLGVWKPSGGEPTGSPLLEWLFNADEAGVETIQRYYILANETLRRQKAVAETVRLDEALKAANLRAEDLRAEGVRRDELMHRLATQCDEALRVQTVLREEAVQHDETIRALQAEKDNALRELAARPLPVEPPLPQLRVYFSRGGIFDEADSRSFSLTPERWERVTVTLPAGWKGGRLRIDPGDGFALVDVAGARIRTATLGAEVWKLLGEDLAAAAEVGGSAQAVPMARTLRVLCAAPDPQIILPGVDVHDYDEPLTLEIGLRLRTEVSSVGRSLQELAGALAEWPGVRAHVRQLAASLDAEQSAHLATVDAHARERDAHVRERDAHVRERDAHARERDAHAREMAAHRATAAELDAARADLPELHRRLQDTREVSVHGQEQLADLQAEQRELQGERDMALQAQNALGREVAGLLAELHDTHLRLAEKDHAFIETARRLDAKDADLLSANARLDADHGRLRSMRRSFSWRLTLPLRVIGRLLTGRSTARQRLARLAPPTTLPDPSPVLTGARDRYKLHLDEPVNWDRSARRVRVRGWCVPTDGDSALPRLLRFRAGEEQTDVFCDVPRADVQAAHGDHPDWRRCGFEAEVALPAGPSRMTIAALDERGHAWTLAHFSTRAPYADHVPTAPTGGNPAHDYAAWIARYDTFTPEDRRRLRERARALPHRPLISVVMPVYNTPEQWLVKAIESVRRQLYPFWELCIADDCSPQPHVREVLRRYERQDERIKVVYREENGHISATSNSALGIATGEFIALLDHDDELAPHALYTVAEAVNEHPDLQVMYSDEDKLNPEGLRCDPYFKPDWNYDLFLGQNMVSHLGVYRRGLLTRIGGFTLGMEGSQDYDLALRCLEHVGPQGIGHLPHILYHWRMIPGSTSTHGDAKPYAREAARRAITAHLDRLGGGATVEQHPRLADFHRVRYPLPTPTPEVAIIIPTRDGAEVLRTCIESLLRHTDYPLYRVVVVDNGSREPATLEYFRELETRLGRSFQVLAYPGEFNFSALNNHAARETNSPLLCLLNNDVEILDAGWLTELATQALRPKVGAAGARLLYPDGTLQHAGIIIGLGADHTAGHIHHRFPGSSFGYFGRALLVQQFSAVTAACMVLRREVFEETEGFNETDFPVGLNDVDLCLRLRERGYVIIWTPFAELRHHESYSRGMPEPGTPAAARARREIEGFRRRHASSVRHDPAYNPNLTLDHADFSFSVPPRTNPSPRRQATLQPATGTRTATVSLASQP